MNSGRECSEDLRSLLLPQLWRRICEEAVPESTTEGPLESLTDVQLWGMLLQSAVTQGNHDRAAALAEQLEQLAHLSDEVNRADGDQAHNDGEPGDADVAIDLDRQLQRIAAAFHLWPFHAARYYNQFGFGNTDQDRIKGRKHLCAIQRILFSDIRWTLDFLRLSFGVRCYEEIEPWLADDPNRVEVVEPRRIETEENANTAGWRSKALCRPEAAPDLCAVDWLCCTMIDLVRSRRHVRGALTRFHQFSIESESFETDRLNEDIRRAFHALHIAQMTAFYSPAITSASLPLEELVFNDLTQEISLQLDGWIPFFDENTFFDGRGRPAVDPPSPDAGRNAFRALASAIYSSSRDSHEWFDKQRKASIEYGKTFDVRFVSSGETTHQFLTFHPPFTGWPVWYGRSLETLLADDGSSDKARWEKLRNDILDWSDHSWWQSVDVPALVSGLFPKHSATSSLHHNHHAAAYVDFRANDTGTEFIDDWEGLHPLLENHPTLEDDPRFGYLMELLLRRSEEYARTSFLFVVSQTHDEKPRIAQFVGGTFLGLERPGVPYEPGRFRCIADYVRPLIIAIANYCTNRMIRQGQERSKQLHLKYESRVQALIQLMQGTSPYVREKQQADDTVRGGLLLFNTINKEHTERLDAPSYMQVAQVFDPHWKGDLKQLASCHHTWKSLLYLPDDTKISTYEEFTKAASAARPARSQREAKCTDCIRSALKYLLDGDYKDGSWIDVVPENTGIFFPSRPGIRYLMSLVDFIFAVRSEVSAGIHKIILKPGYTRIECAKGLITRFRGEAFPSSRRGVAVDAFGRLRKCEPFSAQMQEEFELCIGGWAVKFLRHESFGGGYNVATSEDAIEISWTQ